MLKIGEVNRLKANRQTDNGVYLIDDEENEVLLPNKYIPEGGLEMGVSEMDVFVYTDSEDREVATNLEPKIKLNNYAVLKASHVSNVGAFFDMGLEKDLMVPFSMQAEPIEEGQYYVVYMYLDEKSDRLVGSTKIRHTLKKEEVELEIGEEVDLIPYEDSDIGIMVIVNNQYAGMVFKNEVFTTINVGEPIKGYVKNIRPDFKVDVSLTRFGYRKVEDNLQRILDAIEANAGSLDLNDKSSPEAISEALGMSKKVFKKSIGALYKKKLITITENGIENIK